MANITLPLKFKKLLEQNQELDGIVKSTLFLFSEILEENKLYFFYEYTNHGIKHIQDVLASSDNLISDDTYKNVLTFKDIGYYILSAILHDIGMHVDLYGFTLLIAGEYDSVRIPQFDKLTWKELWDDYLNEAKKFSDKQLKDIFGDEQTIVRNPPLDKPGEISENDKKLIGEFIRRHHPRLAHEIAINGFPAKPNKIFFAEKLEPRARQVIGLIARSHGISLRKCLDYIESVFGRDGRRYPDGVHATYLMILLRIGDYIQIDRTRISKALIKSKTFSSPVSKREHEAHEAIENVDYKWHDDPERIYVTAYPKDSIMFLKLRKLFKDIQYELDVSWAVLGELYGKLEEEKPQIKYRRINSNLEAQNFIEAQDYVADNFKFKANEQILKLMVAPLYGDKPTYGVRELIQNSVDATRERECFMEDGYTPSITVRIEKRDDKKVLFIIEDNGIGMDVEIIKNYFLSAGASFRHSQEWKKIFTDNQGKSLVKRSGKFGVGILSVFLIGKEINVKTRRINSRFGYNFSASIDSDQLNIIKDYDIDIGTRIEIKVDESKVDEFRESEEIEPGVNFSHSPIHEDIDEETLESGYILDYEEPWYKWYVLSSPKITYHLYNRKIEPFERLSPDIGDDLPVEWNKITTGDYEAILWTYNEQISNVRFACNGIKIPKVRLGDNKLIVYAPSLSVFDREGRLPVSLDRNSLTDDVQFLKDLQTDIFKDFIAYFLCFNTGEVSEEIITASGFNLYYPAFGGYPDGGGYGLNKYNEWRALRSFITQILACKNGFILNYNYFIKKMKSIKAVLIQFQDGMPDNINLDIKDYFVQILPYNLKSIKDYQDAIEPNVWVTDVQDWKPFNSRIYLPSDKYTYLFTQKRRLSAWLKGRGKMKFNDSKIVCLEYDEPNEGVITNQFLKEYGNKIHFIREYEIECKAEGEELLNELLSKYIGDDVVIPYSLEERKKKYPLAFKELERYMQKYLKEEV